MRGSNQVTVIAVAGLLSAGGCGEQDESFLPDVPELAALPLGLDPDLLDIPDSNPIEVNKVALGWQLFFDPRLSADDNVSCASCHVPAAGFSDPRPRSRVPGNVEGSRNAPTIVNAALNVSQFWDGRSPSLEAQVLEPIENPIEMANTVRGMEARLNGIPGYREQFKDVFGSERVSADLVAAAIASFERVLLAGNSPWDRWEQHGEAVAVSDAARRGAVLFRGEARCNRCHLGSNLSDAPFGRFHNLGVGMNESEPDLGRYDVTGDEADRGAFRTPTLRQIAQTAPYMHDGSLGTLEDVIEFYDGGGKANPWLDPEMRPLGLTPPQKEDLLAFLQTLTGLVPVWALLSPKLPPG